jgi:tRNA-dihydrouridine synthase 3
MVQRFCKYGLEHWGSDAYGVEQVRYFFLNWHSFACRYVPIGMLEHLPELINWRPPTKFHARK